MVNLTGMLPPGLGGEQEQPKPLSYEPELDLNKTQKFNKLVGKGLGLSDELMSEVKDYVANPPPEPKKSPIDAAIETGYLIADKISPNLTKYYSGLSEHTPEGDKAIRGMFKNALGSDPDWNPVEYAWCATFVSQVLSDLEADPIKSKDRYDRVRADKYKNYGSPVEMDKITEGDIVVFDFNGDNKGDHATFYVGDRDDYFNSNPESPYISVLGGNQGDAVNIREYPKENILAVRRITYDDIDYEFTKELARDNKNFNAFLKKEGEGVDPFSLGTSTMDESNRPFPFDPQYSTFNKGGLSEQTDSMLPAVDDDTRSTQEYLEDTKSMDISSVPAFQRPMDASPNDRLVGEDDAGNPVYRTMLGNTYTVKRNPDQRTTRTKIEEDVLPAVRDYLADPTAPTADQAIAAAKAIAGDAWETISIPGDLLSGEKGASDVTLGEVFELTGGTAAASTMFDVPGGRDTLRIFGGANAKNPPNMTGYGSIDSTFNAEADFKTLENLSVDFENDPAGSMVRVMDEVERNPDKYPSTLKEIVAGNWFRGRDNMMRFEIDDSKSSVKNMDIITDMDEYDMDAYIEGSDFKSGSVFPDSSIQGMPGEKAFTTLEDILVHDELYEKYPDLRNAPVINDVEYFDKHSSTSGYFDPASGAIAINPKLVTTPEKLRATLIHEIQHLVQHLEGFESGTHSSSREVFQIKTALKDSPTAKKALEDYENSVKLFDAVQPKVYEQVLDKNAEVARKLLDLALDKVEKDTGVSAAEIFQGFSENKLLSQIIKEKTGKNYLNFNVESLRNVADRKADTYGSSFVGTKVGSNFAENSRYDDYLGYLSEEEKLDALQGINRKSGFIIQDALKKFDTADGQFASEFLKTFGYPIGELKRQNFFDKDPSNLARFYGIDAPDKPVRPAQFGDHLVYTLKRGETEARLAAARRDIPGSERSPENVFDQEDVPPESQWGEPELKKVKKGEDVFVGYQPKRSASEAPRQFAEGGTVDMNQQMSFAFEDGGLRDDGMRQDPVSGNEVPPGSTAKEVRDDIPAQLSEGEYVVPADVVRYYGVKFFEDLRDNAKMGLQDMEARGRIGGEPVPAGGPMNEDDLTPEEMAAIQEMMGMSEGGTVAGFAPGGLQTDQDFLAAGQQAQQNQFTGFPLGATIFPRAESGEIEAVPTTPTITTEETAESCAAKDMDYDPATKTCVPRAVATTTPAPSDDDDGPKVEPPKWHEKYDYNDPEAVVSKSLATLGASRETEEKETQNALEKMMGSLGTGISSFFENNLVLGGIIRQQKVAEVAANAQLLRAQGRGDLAKQLEYEVELYKDKHDIKDGGFFDSTKTLSKQLASLYSDLGWDEETDTIVKIGGTSDAAMQAKRDQFKAQVEASKQREAAKRQAALEEQRRKDAQKLAQIQSQQDDNDNAPVVNIQTDRDPLGHSTTTTTYKVGGKEVDFTADEDGLNKGGLMASKPKRKAKRQYKKGGLAGKK